jgi:translation initiation factor IF-2
LRELGELPLLNIRMTDVAKELKVGVSTLVDYMKKNGYNIELSPNTKLDQYMYSMLIEEFKS